MSCMPIRHLATSISGSRIAAGEFEHKVHIWDLDSRKCVCSFDTILDFGGTRLAISTDGRKCIAGGYQAGGIVCYSTDDGTEVWRRADLKKSQCIRFSPDDTRIIIEIDDKPCHILDRKTGQTLMTLRGIEDMVESPWQPIVLLVSKKGMELRTLRQEKIATILRGTVAVLDVAFAVQHVCVSESAGPIRCWDTQTGEEIWRHCENGRHALHLCYEPSSQAFLAVDWAYERGGSHRLLCFDVRTGHRQVVSDLGSAGEFAFCLGGASLLTADGTIMDTRTGTQSAQLWSSK